MLKICSLAIILVALNSLTNANPKKPVSVDFRNYTCKFDKVYTNGTFYAKNDVFNMKVNILKIIPRFDASLNILVSTPGANSYRKLARRTIKMCDYLKQPHKDYAFNSIYQFLIRNGNFIKKCPVEPGFYTTNNISLNFGLPLPSDSMELEFKTIVEVILYVPQKIVAIEMFFLGIVG